MSLATALAHLDAALALARSLEPPLQSDEDTAEAGTDVVLIARFQGRRDALAAIVDSIQQCRNLAAQVTP